MSENLESKYLKALLRERKIFGEPHPVVADTLNRLGGVYDSLKKSEKAEQFYRQSLEMREKLYGEEHPDVVSSLK